MSKPRKVTGRTGKKRNSDRCTWKQFKELDFDSLYNVLGTGSRHEKRMHSHRSVMSTSMAGNLKKKRHSIAFFSLATTFSFMYYRMQYQEHGVVGKSRNMQCMQARRRVMELIQLGKGNHAHVSIALALNRRIEFFFPCVRAQYVCLVPAT